MSLYNMLHGVNPMTPLLLGIVRVRMEDIPRFRDVYIGGEPGNRRVAIYTRTGGGNRQCYCNDPWYMESAGRTEPLPTGEHLDGCLPAMNRALAKHPLYDWDEDADRAPRNRVGTDRGAGSAIRGGGVSRMRTVTRRNADGSVTTYQMRVDRVPGHHVDDGTGTCRYCGAKRTETEERDWHPYTEETT